MLFRTADNRLFVRNPNDQFFTDENETRYFVNHDGMPINQHGTLVFGRIITTMHYTADEFLAAFPQHEEYRRFLTERRGTLAVVQSVPPAWFCGGFVIVTFYPNFVHPKNEMYNGKPCVLINDGDDGYMRKTFATDEQAKQAFDELLALAPWYMSELTAFGYKPE